MSRTWTGPARAAAALIAGAGLVVAAAQVPGTLTLEPAAGQPLRDVPQIVPVTASAVSCPGPETEGLPTVPAVAGTATVLAATAPAEALTGVPLAPGAGALTVRAVPEGAALGETTRRAGVVSAVLRGPVAAEVAATGSLAPGLAALQTWLRYDGVQRAQVATPCVAPKAELWLVGGGGQSARRERVVLTNPGANAVSADVTVLGLSGLIPTASGKNVPVPPHGRVTLLLDALVGPEPAPVVHVVATGGVLTGVLQDSWVDGTVGRGADDATPSADPAREQVVPAVFVAGPARLRIAVPGADEAVAQVRVLTATGPQALPGDGVVRVPGSSVRELDLGSLPPGAYAVQVRADRPVVAGAMVERRSGGQGPSDLAWTTSTAPVTVVAGLPLPPKTTGALMLVATGSPAAGTVVTVSAAGAVESKDVTVAADSVTAIDISGQEQVWLRRTDGTLRAGLSMSLADPSNPAPLLSIVPLGSLAVSATQIPVHQVPG